MNGLDLFSGIGGIGLALKDVVRTVAYCENDRYAQAVLLSRMASNDIDRAPIWDDVTSLRGAMLPKIDIIFGGFPCQDISVAGLGKGLEGSRSGLFFEIIRLVTEIKPSFVFLENVPAIRTRGLSQVINAFTEIGYDCRWTCLSAASVGTPHKRERWFLLAYSDSNNLWIESNKQPKRKSQTIIGVNGSKESVANTNGKGLEGHGQLRKTSSSQGTSQRLTTNDDKPAGQNFWSIEPSICRVVNGLPHRVDRIKCLGNSVVPQQVKKAFEKLLGV